MTLYHKGLQNCRLSKLAVKKKLAENPSFIKLRIEIGGPGSIPGRGGLLGAAAVQPFGLQDCIVPFLKPLIIPDLY